jgi:hypothetical protein
MFKLVRTYNATLHFSDGALGKTYRYDHYLLSQEDERVQYFKRKYEVGSVLYLLLLLKCVLSQKG